MSKDHAAYKSREIPIRRVQLSENSQLPSDYSQTPGGTLFSTTPGGTRIIYERGFLMHCRNSPLAKTPPANLPKIPGVTSPRENHAPNGDLPKKIPERAEVGAAGDEPSQFEMDF